VSRGQHAAGDHSFQRSAGGALFRGLALILVAVLLGVVLLRSTDRTTPFTATATGDEKTTTTTAPDDDGTSTTEPPPVHDPAEVSILVANGSGTNGAAARIAGSLAASNFVLKTSTNTKTPASASIVYYAAGYEADAQAIAKLLTPQPGVEAMPAELPVADLAGAQILVVVAADLAGG
jgi:hypothetical protein